MIRRPGWWSHGQIELLSASPTRIQRWTPDEQNIWHATPLTTAPATGPLAIADIDGSGLRTLIFSDSEGWSAITQGNTNVPVLSMKSTAPVRAMVELEPGRGPSMIAMSPGQPPMESKPGPGRFPMITLSLSGRHMMSDSIRSNASGIGAKPSARTNMPPFARGKMYCCPPACPAPSTGGID